MLQQNIIQELKQTQALLVQEKQEDLEQYKLLLSGTSFLERRKQGVLWYPVKVEKSKFDSGERLLIKIVRPKEHRESHSFQSGKLVKLFANSEQQPDEEMEVNGIVNQVNESDMLITLSCDDLPKWLDNGKLGVQLLFDENSYLEMERAMRLVIEPNDARLLHLRSILLGHSTALFAESKEIALPQLNKIQNQALNKVLSAQDVAIIHGPPGTGKTTTMVHAIAQTVKTEHQVLVCAPSNAAIDLLVEKLYAMGIIVVRIGHPARVTQENLNCTLDAQIAHHPNYNDLKMVKRKANELREQAFKFKRNFGPEEREQRHMLLKEADGLKKEASHLRFYITSDVLSKAQVIATTLVGAANGAIRDRKYGTLFIDEAAQALEPATWIPITKAQRVIFAGDHCQLPPTIKSFSAANKGLNVTLFEKTIKQGDVATMLCEQYRMNSQIMNFPSSYFYNNKLEANGKVANWRMFNDDLPIEFVDTAGCGFFEQSDDESKSITNPEEAQLLMRHLNQYINLIHLSNNKMGTLAVISPYRAQTVLLQNILNGLEVNDQVIDFKINTIDSFQGQESDVVYISMVRSNEKSIIGFLSDIRRMNVAMTRARKKLVVIGDSATIGNHPFYAAMLDYCANINAYRSGFEFMY